MDLDTRMRLASLSTDELLRQREALVQELGRLRQQRFYTVGWLALGSLLSTAAIVLASRWPPLVGLVVSATGLLLHVAVVVYAVRAYKERNW